MVLTGLDSSAGQAQYALTIIFETLAIVAVGLRIWAKRLRGRPFLLHDYLIFGALIASVAYAVTNLVAIYPYSIGLHITDAVQQGPAAFESMLKCVWASIIPWTTSTALIKLSILHFYVSIFTTNIKLRRCAYVLAATTIAFWAAYIVASCLTCQPIQYNWDRNIPGGNCGSNGAQVISVAIINFVLDAAITILPLPVVWGLQMPRKKKLYLTGIVCLATLICAINAIRIGLVATADEADFTFTSVKSGLLSGLEIYLGIIIACVPMFGPILARKALGYESGPKPRMYGRMAEGRQDRLDTLERGVCRQTHRSPFDAALSDRNIPLAGIDGSYSGSHAVGGTWSDASKSGLTEDGINVQTDITAYATHKDSQEAIHNGVPMKH